MCVSQWRPYLLIRRLPRGVNSSMADSFFHGQRHGGDGTLLVETRWKGELREENHSNVIFCTLFKEEGIDDVSAKNL